MASIRKRNGLWQAQVRSRKLGSTSKSFHKKSDAVAWAKVQEAMMQTGEWKPKDKRYSTIGDLLQTYLFKATPNKKGAGPETVNRQKGWGYAVTSVLRDHATLSVVEMKFCQRREYVPSGGG